jgi:hypothetical protein
MVSTARHPFRHTAGEVIAHRSKHSSLAVEADTMLIYSSGGLQFW